MKYDKKIVRTRKLKKHIIFKGTMTAESDIHIGGSSVGTQVGGCDNPILINSIDLMPYIPGSSIKGKMRMQAEVSTGKGSNGNPCKCGKEDCLVCTMFGPFMNTLPECGQPRLLVRNMYVNKQFIKQLNDSGIGKSNVIDTRTSTMINRATATAASNSLRTIQVVSANTVFDCEFVLRVFDTDNADNLIKSLKKMIKNLQAEGIGSKITTGYGQVRFDINWDNPEEINY